MEIAIVVVLALVVALAALTTWWLIKNTVSIRLAQFERITVFKSSGEFSDVRGPGNFWIWPDIKLFVLAGPIIISGEEIRGTHGQIVDNDYLKGYKISSRGEIGRDLTGLGRSRSDATIDIEGRSEGIASRISTPKPTFDLRETSINLGQEHCITRDSAVVAVHPSIVYQITDPQKLVLNISNHEQALVNAVNSALRATVGGMSLTDVITGRTRVAAEMTAALSEQADRWGITVVGVDIQDIRPGEEVEEAMNKRRAAEETAEQSRQANVVQAQAELEGSSIRNDKLLAEAEAQKRAAIILAEGDKESEILKAEGAAALYKMLMDLGDGADVALRYEQIQALRNLGDSSNSKLVVVPANVAANMTTLNGLHDIPFVEGILPPANPDGGK